MDLTLTPAQLELQARARSFVRDVLQPRELEFERANGHVPRDWGDPIRRAAIEARLHGGSFPVELGGRAGRPWRVSSCMSSLGSRPVASGPTSPGLQRARPRRRGPAHPVPRPVHARGAVRRYAVTEDGAGSDARALRATAVRDTATGEYVLDGEKWFVTGPDDTDFMIVQVNVVEAEERRPTLFLVDYDAPGVRLNRLARCCSACPRRFPRPTSGHCR